jgi:hypothetical protein
MACIPIHGSLSWCTKWDYRNSQIHPWFSTLRNDASLERDIPMLKEERRSTRSFKTTVVRKLALIGEIYADCGVYMRGVYCSVPAPVVSTGGFRK